MVMRRTLIAATCMLVFALAGQANAKIIAGQYVPDGLEVGDQFRLIFVTSGSIFGDSANAAAYDGFLADQVAGTMLSGYNWTAVLSTPGIFGVGARTARDVVLNETGLVESKFKGIYNTNPNSQVVSSTGLGMLDGALDYPVLFDQHGTSIVSGYAWTGSNADGTAASGYIFGSALVGDSTGRTVIGDAAHKEKWLSLGDVQRTVPFSAGVFQQAFRVYGISDVITVVPEPATIVMWSLFAGVAGLVFWRKGRKSS